MRKKLFATAGMHNSGLDRNGLPLSNRALGYERHLGPRYVDGPCLDLTHIFSAGAMYSTVEDLFRWNQAMSSDAVLSKAIREQIFRPGLGDWGYGWYVTKIPPEQPGAGRTFPEMRGDMPGNFFSSISRYPERDALIVVLRNGYGSSERLEWNLQAVLFDQNPHLPWRKPAGILVGAFYSTASWVHGHRLFAALTAVLFLVLVVRLRQRTARASQSHQ
jgi:CubicO group peptidase (beta-lactamase class C family)